MIHILKAILIYLFIILYATPSTQIIYDLPDRVIKKIDAEILGDVENSYFANYGNVNTPKSGPVVGLQIIYTIFNSLSGFQA